MPDRRRVGARAVAVLAVLSSLLVAAAVPAAPPGETARWVVRFAPGESTAAQAAALDRAPVHVVDRSSRLRAALVVADDEAVRRLRRDPRVAAVRAPVPMTAFATPNDPLFPRQWNLRAVQAPAAWDVTTGTGVTVAVLDTGVRRSLTDLSGTRFRAGVDLVDGDGDPDDEQGHGTHVTGTIAQTTNNGIGVSGVAHGATIMPVRVLDARGAGDDYTVARGIEYAVANGADVINLSLGSPTSSLLLYEAVQLAASSGVTIVAAVGNEGVDRIAFPAAYEEVLAVGAVALDLTLAPYSNRGPELDLVAPGGDTSRDVDGDGYGDGILQQTFLDDAAQSACFCFFQGTSMAAPHVAGAAALLLAAGADGPMMVRRALLSTARDLGPTGPDPSYGAGLLQAASALQALSSLQPEPAPAPEPPPTDDPVSEPEEPLPSSGPGEARAIDRACPEGEVPEAGFRDVDPASAHAFAIDCVAWRELAAGVAVDRYDPTGVVTRAQMATFLARTIEAAGRQLPTSPPDAFGDDDGSVHEHRINQLAAVGVVKGQLDRTYQPRLSVTRAQMATFLSRAVEEVLRQPLPRTFDNFDDDDGHVHETRIDAVAEAGIAAGVGVRTYAPDRAVQRGQMASFLARTLDYLYEATGR